MNGQLLTWLILAVIFLAVELSTSTLVSVWFVIGALFSMVAAYFNASLFVQIVTFVLVSATFLILVMPFSRKLLKNKKQATNSDRIIGQAAVVTEDIDTLNGKGQIKVMGSVWSAKTENGEPLPKGSAVTVLNIEGVKAVVKER